MLYCTLTVLKLCRKLNCTISIHKQTLMMSNNDYLSKMYWSTLNSESQGSKKIPLLIPKLRCYSSEMWWLRHDLLAMFSKNAYQAWNNHIQSNQQITPTSCHLSIPMRSWNTSGILTKKKNECIKISIHVKMYNCILQKKKKKVYIFLSS